MSNLNWDYAMALERIEDLERTIERLTERLRDLEREVSRCNDHIEDMGR